MKTKKHPSDLSAVDLIKYLNGRRGWHGNQYRSVCGEWLRKAEIRRDALRELASESQREDAGKADDDGEIGPLCVECWHKRPEYLFENSPS